MKILKISFLTIASAALLSACGGGVAPILSTPIENIDTMPLKAAPLPDKETKN